MKYKYNMLIGNSLAEAVHGTVTQEQVYFWKKNFGKNYNEYLHSYIYSWNDELNESGLIPEDLQLGHWHEIDDVEHINAPHYNYAFLDVTDADGKTVGGWSVSQNKQLVKTQGVIIDESFQATKDTPVHLYAFSSEKGSFDLMHYKSDDDKSMLLTTFFESSNADAREIELNEPFDFNNMEFHCTSYADEDLFVTGVTYKDGDETLDFDMELEYSHGKSSGTWIAEDTLAPADEITVPILTDEQKKEILKVMTYEGDELDQEIEVINS